MALNFKVYPSYHKSKFEDRGSSGIVIFITAFMLWLLGILIMLGFWIAVIYVVWHFISKFW